MVFIVIALFWNKMLSMSHIPWKKLFVLCNCWMVFSLSLQLQPCLIYTELYIQSPEICQVMLQVYEQFSSFLANFAVNILYLHWALRKKIFVYYCKNCCKLMQVFHNVLPQWRHSLCLGARPYTRVAQKVMPHIFFSEAIYSECMKFMYSITGCFLYTLFFHIISIYVYGLTPAWNKDMHAFPLRACFLFT